MEIRVDDLKVTLVFQKGRFLLIPFFNRFLKSSDTFSAVNVTRFLVSNI